MAGSSRINNVRYEALIELLRTAETLWNSSRAFFIRWDLSPSQFNVLNLLQETPGGCSQSEVSRQLIMHRSNVTGLIDRLEARGLVQRKENDTDRRAFNLFLTSAGKKMVAEIHPHYFRAAESAWAGISETRASKLIAELKSISLKAESAAASLKQQRSPKKRIPKD